MAPGACVLTLASPALSEDSGAKEVDPEPLPPVLPAPAREDVVLMATEGETASLDALAPPTLPDLTHGDASIELDYTGAGIGQGTLGRTLTWMAFLRTEVPLTTRHWHVGAAWDLVSAAAEGRGRALVYGNPEVWVRGVGWHSSGLSAGGGLGVVIPVPRDLGAPEAGVLDTIRVIRPWDSGYFTSSILTLRPSIDVRLILEPFLLQLRQGLDWSYNFDASRSDILARTGTYFAVAPLDWLTTGLELWHTYSITHDIEDDQRSALTLSPVVRMRFGPVEPGISVLFPVSTPLEGIATEFFAVRLHLRLALGSVAEPATGGVAALPPVGSAAELTY